MATMEKPPFLGYDTPFLSIYDHQGNLILDRITTEGGGDRPLAIADFSYTFNETEDDKGSITLWSNSVDFLNNLNLRHKAVLYLEWGYLSGDKRPKLRVLIRNYKNKYNSEGYRLILEISDNYAPAKNAMSSTRAKLEDVRDYLAGVTDPDSKEKIKAFLNPLEQYRPKGSKYVESSNNYEPSSGRFIPTGSVADAERASGMDLPLDKTPDQPFQDIKQGIKDPTGVIDEATIRFYQGLGIAPWDIPQNTAEPVDSTKLQDKPSTYAEGTNAKALVQDMVDKTSSEPTGVTGSDGNIKIFKKRRASLTPPITEYEFNGGSGRLLEFDYDSDSTYDEDESVLRTIGVNPETGALEQTDYANSIRKIEDAYTPTQFEQAKLEARLYEQYIKAVLKGEEFNTDGEQVVSGTPMLIQNPTTALANGGYISAVDNTAVTTVLKAMPLSFREEALEAVENELKNLKGDEAFRVRATAKTLGDPSISNGVNILIKGLSNKDSGTYHITSCTHSINSGGYTNSYEMYKVSDIPVNTDTIKSSTGATEVKAKIDKVKDKQIESLRLGALIDSQGYITPGQINPTDYYTTMDKLDKDWITKVGYTDYVIAYQITGHPVPRKIIIRVPNDPGGNKPDLNDVFSISSIAKISPAYSSLRYKVEVLRTSPRLQ